jgi:ubiquinone/menaquinone biosynthesis C-methylase UbiE
MAESIPLDDNSCDVVLSSNVIEHVLVVEAAFQEVFRILKSNGIFWFSAASCICPYQKEIEKFPLFPWYPNKLKLRIMKWAKNNKQHLVGGTDAPAVNWFTPEKARSMCREAGFSRIYDRWNLRLLSEGGQLYRLSLSTIRLCFITKFFADLLCEGCAYAAIKL